ncbi:MAG: adenylate/guanylate cyclase domain-containing protein, partial [Sphingomonadaceae bacterium]|nr:adenylate/guanylate cyclase domain-containing protein [Sphingomonadaceae bacterium]
MKLVLRPAWGLEVLRRRSLRLLKALRRRGFLVRIVLFALLLVVGQGALLAHHGLLLPLAAPLLAVFLPTALQVAWGYAVESRSRRQMATLFASYVPPEIVQRLAENPGAYSMKPLERELTVLFADVRGFTTVSESLSPQALADWINEYLTAMSLVIREQHHGTLDK